MTRIKIRNTDGTGEYQLPINPIRINLMDSEDYTLYDTLDGAAVKQKAAFDSRQRSWYWNPHKTSGTTQATNFNTMHATLRSYKGKRKEIKLEDADYLGLYSSHGWMEIEVDDVKTERAESGEEKFSIEFIYHYIQSY